MTPTLAVADQYSPALPLAQRLAALRAAIVALATRDSRNGVLPLEQVPLGTPFRYAVPSSAPLAGSWMRTAVPPGAPKTFALYCVQVRGENPGAVIVSGPKCPVIVEVHAHQLTTGGAA